MSKQVSRATGEGRAATFAGLLYFGAVKCFAAVVVAEVAVTVESIAAANRRGVIKVVPFNIGWGLNASNANTNASQV